MMISLHVNDDIIESTARHPYRVVRGENLEDRPLTAELGDDNEPTLSEGRWVEARYLQVGDTLISKTGEVTIDDLSAAETTVVVYNFTVEDSHAYTVGETSILVHNASPDNSDATCGVDTCSEKGFEYQEKAPTGYDSWKDYVLTGCSGTDEDVPNPHGHHIVMKGNAFEENKKARQILCKYDINPYTGCENLVISRNYCHSRRYAERVLSELEKEDKKKSATKRSISIVLRELADWHLTCGDLGTANEETDEI